LHTTLESFGVSAFIDKDGVRTGIRYPLVLARAVRRPPSLLLVRTDGAMEALTGAKVAGPEGPAGFQDDPGRWIPHEISLAHAAASHIVIVVPEVRRAKTDDGGAPETPNQDVLRTRDLPEEFRFLAHINQVRFRMDEFHAASVQKLFESLRLPRRISRQVKERLKERETAEDESADESWRRDRKAAGGCE